MRAFAQGAATLVAVAGVILSSAPAFAGPVEDRADQAAKILGRYSDDHLSKKKAAELLGIFSALTPLQRWRVFEVLDRSQATQLRTIYERLDDAGQTQLLALCKASGDAASAAGLQKIGVISDVDDTAIPTEYQPDGKKSFDGARHFYDTLTHEPIHYVSARPKAFIPETRVHLEESGMPAGTFDTRSNVWGILFGGLNDIQKSKVANIEKWIALHPGQRFVFLGDTIQRDPETYREVREKHPEAVAAIFIHEAGGPKRDKSQYAGVTFFNDYPEAEALWTAHAKDPKPLPSLTPAATHPVDKTAGKLTTIGAFFHDVKVVVSRGFSNALSKIGIGDGD